MSVTELLRKAGAGDKESLDRVLPLVYEELRKVARHQLQSERADHTLQPTALVHEAYVRLMEQTNVNWENRIHFFSIAAQMMRRILINYAVERNAQKRGAGVTKISLEEARAFSFDEKQIDFLALDENLERLEKMDARQGRIVELKFFGGLKIEEISRLLEISPATVKREWQMAKSWLQVQMTK